MYKTVESMRTKDGIYVDRVTRPEGDDSIAWAKQRKWYFLYNCSLDSNLAWATCEIKDDEGATYDFEKYEAPIVVEAPTAEEEPPEEEKPIEE